VSEHTLLYQLSIFSGEGPIIDSFGINGDGLNIAISSTSRRDVQIHCGSTRPGIVIDWYNSEGVKIGIKDRNLREGHYDNGTTILQVAASRRLSECDGGVYTCIAEEMQTGAIHQRNFTLMIGSESQ